MNESYKILHIMSSFGGGISSFIRNKALSIDDSHITMDVASFNEVPKEFELEINSQGGEVYLLPNPKKEGFTSFFKEYKGILEKNGPYSMVHCHLGGHRAFPFYLISKAMGVNRFVLHAHNSGVTKVSKETKADLYMQKLNQLLNKIGSDQMASCGVKASKYYFGEKSIINNKVMHIPNSIDVNQFMLSWDETKKMEIKKKNKIPVNVPIIGTVGRFDENKNQIFQVKLIERMAEKGLEFCWIFIGDGVTRSDIASQISMRGLDKYVRFLGRREDVPSLYQLMDVFVLTSYTEGLPTVCIESQTAGVPCVVSDSITREIDLELGLVEFVSLEKVEQWIKKINHSLKKKTPKNKEILSSLKDKKFTNVSSAELYKDFIKGNLSHYTIN